MSNPSTLLASTVMNIAASLLNDSARSAYTYAIQLPYLTLALQELREELELANIPVTTKLSTEIEIDAGVEEVTFAPAMPVVDTPYLPDDFVEPRFLWTRQRDTNPWVPMGRIQQLPEYELGSEIAQLSNYVWQDQKITFLAASGDNDIKMTYIKQLFTAVIADDDEIGVVNAATYLEYKTAALCARFVMENPTRADSLDILAIAGLDRAEGIGIKGQQAILTRRRPFRSGYKSRGRN